MSVDSIVSQYTDLYRGKHEKVIDAIELISKENYRNVYLISTLSKHNIDQVKEVEVFAEEKLMKHQFAVVDVDFNHNLSWYNATEEEVDKLLYLAETWSKNGKNKLYKKLIEFILNNKHKNISIPNCYYANKSMVVDVNGDVYPCFHNRKTLGNIKKSSVKDIFNSHLAFRENSKGNYDCLQLKCLPFF